jgi:small subunit ribosomal protein S4
MSRFIGPRLKIVRRLGELSGLTQKTSNLKNPPGEHGQELSKKKLSQYNTRLQEKQKLRFFYGLTERQLLNYVRKARKGTGSVGEVLLQLLEMRLDTIIFRLGLAPTLISARQMVNHGHIMVNSKVVNIPSYLCVVNDFIQLKNSKKSKNLFEFQLTQIINGTSQGNLTYLSIQNPNQNDFKIHIQKRINRSNINLDINERLIIEYYSRKG